jgi:hypothetical protein
MPPIREGAEAPTPDMMWSLEVETIGRLRIDPTFTPLRRNPRFQRLVKGCKQSLSRDVIVSSAAVCRIFHELQHLFDLVGFSRVLRRLIAAERIRHLSARWSGRRKDSELAQVASCATDWTAHQGAAMLLERAVERREGEEIRLR